MEENNYLEIMNNVIDMIKNGVVTKDEKIRPFDLIDYYFMYKVDFEKLYNSRVGKISVEDNLLFSKFADQYKSYGMLSEQLKPMSQQAINNELELKNEFNCKRDEKKMPILGTGRTIARDEKEEIFNYLIANEIPLNKVTARLGIQRYLDNTLFDSKTENQTR